MDFDWLDASFDLKQLTPREIEESFEDPFAIRLLPDNEDAEAETRFFCLGTTVTGRHVFSVFWSDGKKYRVILSRDMSDQEQHFYERKNAEYQ